MITKKDFKAVAEVIKNSKKDLIITYSTAEPHIKCAVVDGLADYFATQNPRFDRSRFMKACGLTE